MPINQKGRPPRFPTATDAYGQDTDATEDDSARFRDRNRNNCDSSGTMEAATRRDYRLRPGYGIDSDDTAHSEWKRGAIRKDIAGRIDRNAKRRGGDRGNYRLRPGDGVDLDDTAKAARHKEVARRIDR